MLINTGAFPCGAEWKGLVATLEGALHLHRRTGGMTGSLSHLVRAAAQLAILEGDEAITRKLMDTIPVDQAAESSQASAA